MYFRLRLACSLLLLPAVASAYEIGTPVSESCHEELTLAAAAAASFPAFAQAPAPTDEQRRAMNDLVFDLPRRDPWTLALLIGVRSNDLEDRAPTDIAGLSHIHDDPDKQGEHCIRRGDDDGAAGDANALAACRAFIIGELETGGLLAEQLDLAATERVSSYFKFRGVYTIHLPKFAYRLGRAIHAVEDGYAHAMRDPASGDVRHVLNWVDAFGGTNYEEERDGYPHLSTLDDCRRTDSVQVSRLMHTRNGAASIFAAIAMEGPGRRARVEAAVDAVLRLIPNCTPENDYCNAPELSEPKDRRGFGCDASNSPASLLFGLALLALVMRRRTVAIAILVAAPMLAYAQQPVPSPTPAPAAPAPATPEPAPAPATTEPAPVDPATVTEPPTDEAPAKDLPAEVQDRSDFTRWHFDARAGGAWDDPAIAGAIGLAVDYKRWSIGLYGEWNPWLSFDELGSTRRGVANVFFTFSYRWYHSARIALATRIEAGTSIMLFELLGIDKYTAGIYLGGALTTVRFPINERMSLTFDPIHFALPTPRPFGLPYYYKQYRVTFGLEIAL